MIVNGKKNFKKSVYFFFNVEYVIIIIKLSFKFMICWLVIGV